MSGRRVSAAVVERRRDAVFAVLLVCGMTVLAAVVIWVQQLSHDLREANAARDALARQVQQLGASPVAGPPGSRGIVGATGPSGPSGPQGPAGARGASGAAGKAGASGLPGLIGATGPAGVDGVQGPPGPTGAAGPTGPAGSDGRDGSDGTDGRDGQTCPDGYSLQTPPDDPDALVCRHDATPLPSPSPTPTTAVAVLPPGRRRAG